MFTLEKEEYADFQEFQEEAEKLLQSELDEYSYHWVSGNILDQVRQREKEIREETDLANQEKLLRPCRELRKKIKLENCFTLEGDCFHIRFDGAEKYLKKSKGLQYLQYLIEHQGQYVSMADLDQHINLTNPKEYADNTPDTEAMEDYKTRLMDLENNLQEANELGDYGWKERIESEKDTLLKELRPKRKKNPLKDKIGKPLTREIQKIKKEIPALATHLTESIPHFSAKDLIYNPAQKKF